MKQCDIQCKCDDLALEVSHLCPERLGLDAPRAVVIVVEELVSQTLPGSVHYARIR